MGALVYATHLFHRVLFFKGGLRLPTVSGLVHVLLNLDYAFRHLGFSLKVTKYERLRIIL